MRYLFFLCVLILPSCATKSAINHDGLEYDKPPYKTVRLYMGRNATVDREYKIIGEAQASYALFTSRKQMFKALRKAAASIGGEGIIVTDGQGDVIKGHVIRYNN